MRMYLFLSCCDGNSEFEQSECTEAPNKQETMKGRLASLLISGVRGVRWAKVYGTNLDQVGPKKANLDQLGQVGRRFAVFCLLREAPLTNLDQVGPVLFPTVFRALPIITYFGSQVL